MKDKLKQEIELLESILADKKKLYLNACDSYVAKEFAETRKILYNETGMWSGNLRMLLSTPKHSRSVTTDIELTDRMNSVTMLSTVMNVINKNDNPFMLAYYNERYIKRIDDKFFCTVTSFIS